MAEKSNFFAKLFGAGLSKLRFFRHKPPAPRDKPGSAPHPRPARVGDKPLKLADEQRKAALPKAPPVDPYLLSLPVDHPLYELWRLYKDQSGWMSRPEITFKTQEPQIFTPEDAQAALPRLKAMLTAAAVSRLEILTPKPVPQPQAQEPSVDALPEEEAPPVQLDAEAVVYTAADRQSAWLLLFPPMGGGAAPTQADLMSALNAAGVCFGIDEEALVSLAAGENPYFRLSHVASGKPAVPGKDGAVIDLYPRVFHREMPVDEFNRVDYTAICSTQNVEKGAAICHISPPTPGVPGCTVTGQDLPARDGVPAVPPMGRNTALSEDGSELLATLDGGLEFSGNAFQINPLLEIAGDVDYSSGSINFLGDVHIHGDVCTGFSVRAMGNIKVDGVVESASIEAGGDLVLAKGVQGNGQAVLRAHRDIFAKYLENCSVHAHEDLHSECIIGCDVYSDAGVYVQNGRGAIIGGNIWAAREVDANIVGSKTEVPTTITLGGLPCEDYEKSQLTLAIEALEQNLKDTERQPSSPAKLSRMSKMRMQISVNKLKLNQYNKNLEEFQNNADKRPVGRLTFRTAYGNTRVVIGGSMLHITDEVRHSIATLVNGEVKLIT